MTGFPLLLLLLFGATGVLTAILPQLGGVAFFLLLLSIGAHIAQRRHASRNRTGDNTHHV